MYDFTIKPDEGDEYEVTATSRDVLVWEKTTKGGTLASLLGNPKMGDLYRLAHLASRRLGLFTDDLAEFEKTCELEFTETEAAGPTSGEASAES